MIFSDLDVISTLQLGVVGLGFLLALLSFWLLSKEQRLKAPRDSYLNSIRLFMKFSIVLCVIGLIPQILPFFSGPSDQQISKLENEKKDLLDETLGLKERLSQSEQSRASVVFEGVCKNQYFQCQERVAANSKPERYRPMSPYEQQICDLACK